MISNKPYAIILCLFCGSFYTASYAQLSQPSRYELERKFNDENFTIISLKKDGLALIREKNKYKSGNRTWEVVLLDTLLQESGKVEFDIDNQNRLIGYEHSQGAIHFLFNWNVVKGYMDLLTINLKNKEITRFEIKPELNLRLTHFCKVGENFIFGGFVNRESAVLHFSPSQNHLKILPGFFQKDVELIDIKVNQNQTFNTLLIDRGEHISKKILLRTFDSAGKQLLENFTAIDDGIVLQSGLSSALEREDLIILGTWGKINSKQASGFYALPVNPFEDSKIKRIHFGELNHYLDYLKPKRASAIKLKSLNDLKEGKIPDFANYTMPYKIVEHPAGFLLFAESYSPSSTMSQYPTYSPYSTYPYYSPFGGYYPSSRVYAPTNPNSYENLQDIQEITTLSSSVIAFNAHGEVIWDFSLKLTEVKMPSLEQVSDFILNNNKIVLLYKKESEIKVKSINLVDQEIKEYSENIRLNSNLDEIRHENSQVGLIKHWFGNNFYVWGNQSIRNKTNTETRIREVFYLNKVVAH